MKRAWLVGLFCRSLKYIHGKPKPDMRKHNSENHRIQVTIISHFLSISTELLFLFTSMGNSCAQRVRQLLPLAPTYIYIYIHLYVLYIYIYILNLDWSNICSQFVLSGRHRDYDGDYYLSGSNYHYNCKHFWIYNCKSLWGFIIVHIAEIIIVHSFEFIIENKFWEW